MAREQRLARDQKWLRASHNFSWTKIRQVPSTIVMRRLSGDSDRLPLLAPLAGEIHHLSEADSSRHSMVDDRLDEVRREERERKKHGRGASAAALLSSQCFNAGHSPNDKVILPAPGGSDCSEQARASVRGHHARVLALSLRGRDNVMLHAGRRFRPLYDDCAGARSPGWTLGDADFDCGCVDVDALQKIPNNSSLASVKVLSFKTQPVRTNYSRGSFEATSSV